MMDDHQADAIEDAADAGRWLHGARDRDTERRRYEQEYSRMCFPL